MSISSRLSFSWKSEEGLVFGRYGFVRVLLGLRLFGGWRFIDGSFVERLFLGRGWRSVCVAIGAVVFIGAQSFFEFCGAEFRG